MRSLLLTCFLAWAGSSFGAEIKIDFGESANFLMPTNFHGVLAGTGQPGDWKITSDEFPSLFPAFSNQPPAMVKRPVLAQTSQDVTDERFPILVYDGDRFTDFKLTTKFKIVSGVSEQMAGVVFRFQNASNFYVVRASALGHNVRFYKMVNGVRSDPIGPQLDVSTGVWHTLSVQCSGTQIIFWFDNNPGLQVNDATFASGNVGFWTKSDSVSYFSDLTVDFTPAVSAAQTLVDNIIAKESRLLGLRIYTLDSQGETHVIASKVAGEKGLAGGTAEKAAIDHGTVSFGRGPGTVAVWLPFRDRNGDPMAAVWVRLKSFIGETQDTAVTRATEVLRRMQTQIDNSDDLLK